MSDDAFRAMVDMVLYGFVEEGDEVVHEIVLYEDESFDISFETADEEGSLVVRITDEDDNILFSTPGAVSSFDATIEPEKDSVIRLYVRAETGEHEYSFTINEQE